ncbi:MAG TPA: hypothetical protein V6C81_12725 [Planktothrix sp.]
MTKALASIERWMDRHSMKFVYSLAAVAVMFGLLAAGSIGNDMLHPQPAACYADDCPL